MRIETVFGQLILQAQQQEERELRRNMIIKEGPKLDVGGEELKKR